MLASLLLGIACRNFTRKHLKRGGEARADVAISQNKIPITNQIQFYSFFVVPVPNGSRPVPVGDPEVGDPWVKPRWFSRKGTVFICNGQNLFIPA